MLTLIYEQPIWQYFSDTQRDLIREGNYLMEFVEKQGYQFKDYSFLVFPYAKAYEGFLKQIFLDMRFISHLDYISDHYRIGKFLSPHLVHKLEGRSVYMKLMYAVDEAFARKLWETWRNGRNQVFHYYPHNIKRLTFQDADKMNNTILNTMLDSYDSLIVSKK